MHAAVHCIIHLAFLKCIIYLHALSCSKLCHVYMHVVYSYNATTHTHKCTMSCISLSLAAVKVRPVSIDPLKKEAILIATLQTKW